MKISSLFILLALATFLHEHRAYGYGGTLGGPAPKTESGGPSGNFTVGAEYGIGFISPTDINNNSAIQATTPGIPSISHSSYYSGFIGYRLLPEFDLQLIYQSESANNATSTTLGPTSGYTLNQNEIWLTADYYFLLSSAFYSYFGAGIGYPTYSHVTENLVSKNEYDADKAFGLLAQLGFGVLLGDHAGLYVRAAYQQEVTGIVKNSSGGSLLTTSGNSAVIDLSGLRMAGGLQFFF